MLVSQISETAFPRLTIFDKAGFALNLMDDYDVLHLPVLTEEKYTGLISKEDLLDAEDSEPLSALHNHFLKSSVLPDEHILSALKVAGLFDISVIPVVTVQGEMKGIITQKNLIRSVSSFLSVEEPGGLIVIEMDKRNFSIGEISRLVETNDAIITQLNTYEETATGVLIVTIKINRLEISDIIATLQRYDYNVRYYFGTEDYENELKENYDLLMTYLKI